MSTPPLVDQDARITAERVLDRSFLVEAGAGTGKTTLLISRLVNLVLAGTPLSAIVAITFTEAAAGELKIRLRQALEERYRRESENGDEDSEGSPLHHVKMALEELEGATVSTIHGFCASLLRERPVEAGVDPGFEVADSDRAAELLEEALQEYTNPEAEDEDVELREALEAGMTSEQLRKLAEGAIEQRDLLPEVTGRVDETSDAPTATELVDEFDTMVAELTRTCAQCKDETDTCLKAIRMLSAAKAAYASLGVSEKARELTRFRSGLKKKGALKKWESEDVVMKNRERLEEFQSMASRYARSLATSNAAGLLHSLQRFGGHYEEKKRRAGVLDYNDLLLKARDLLKGDVSIRNELKKRYSAVLLDEFQDTDPLQAEIAFFLAEDPEVKPAGEWHEVEVGPGRLFLVGDPKQSIYRFRRADIEIYAQAKKRIEATGGEVLAIRVNFRSQQKLVRWVNARFSQLIVKPTGERNSQPDYQDIEEGPNAASGVGRVSVLADLSREVYGGINEARVAEANAVASLIFRSVESGTEPLEVMAQKGGGVESRPLRFGDCAVLFRTLTSLEIYEESLRNHGVPYQVIGGKHLFRRIEIKTATALFRAIDDPTDGIAEVAVLRGFLFGVSDSDLVRFCALGGKFGALHPEEPEGTPEAIVGARAILRDLRSQRQRLDLAQFVEEIYRKTRMIELFRLKPHGEQRAANLRSLLEKAADMESTAGATFRAFAQRIVTREKKAMDEADAAPPDGGANAVQLLTMHKAKGLEFPLVVIADAYAEAGKSRSGEFVWDRGSPPRLGFAIGSKGKYLLETGNYENLKAMLEECDAEEQIRLFYVATTRARDYLFLPKFCPKKKNKKALASLLEDDPIFTAGADAADGMVTDVADWDSVIPKTTAFGLDLDPEGDLSRGAKDILKRRKELVVELAGVLDRKRHRLKVTSPSRDKEMPVGTESSTPRKEKSGSRGPAFGTLVHRVLEVVPLDAGAREVEVLVSDMARGAPFDDESLAAAAELTLVFLTSDLGERIRAAKRVEREPPFVFPSDGGLMEGSIDLLAEEEDGRYLIVDFKTDSVAGEALDERLELYRHQGEVYEKAVRETTGKEVSDVLFHFLRSGEVRSIPESRV